MANSVELDQTAPVEQSDLNLHHLFRYVCLNALIFMPYTGSIKAISGNVVK